MTADPEAPKSVESFSGRVLVLFATSVVTTGIGIVNGFMLARFLGPSGKGDFYLLTLLPVTVMVLLQLGLPQAMSYYAASGRAGGATQKSVWLTLVLSTPAVILVVVLLPVLRATILDFIDGPLILLGFAVLPLALNATFTTGILLGRQAVRWYSIVNIGLTVAGFGIYVLLVGVLGLGLVGALWAALVVSLIGTVGYFLGAARGGGTAHDTEPVTYRALFRFGLPVYPGTLTQFFALRVDVYLLAWLLADPSAPLGFYSMAVTMAQLVFFLPNAISTLFFPHVAGATREDSDRQVALVSRITLLTTSAAAIALVPTATILIKAILPAFDEALPAFYVLLPGVVALSQTKVLSSYIAGVGKTGWTSTVNVGALVLNVVANLVLIPPFGIVGAAGASLLSYSVSAVACTVVATRLAHRSATAFWIPRPSDVRFAASTVSGLARRVVRSA